MAVQDEEVGRVNLVEEEELGIPEVEVEGRNPGVVEVD